MAATAASTGGSFIQAGKQRRIQRQAEEAAAKAMAEARKKLDVNYYENLAINKEPYELEREMMLVQGAMATEAGRESERGTAATAGRVQLAQQQGQRQIAAAMSQELTDLEKITAAEEGRLRDMKVGLDLAEVEGAQDAAAIAEARAAGATAQGLQGIVSLGQQVAAAAPLYSKQKEKPMKGADVSGFDFSGASKQAAKRTIPVIPTPLARPQTQPTSFNFMDYINALPYFQAQRFDTTK
ncbi:MAG: hypothetical protein [Podoviridae sp. ctrTa16]|nr:MAG: hypothetical protein [Podoviridae sp. ctrTa16]